MARKLPESFIGSSLKELSKPLIEVETIPTWLLAGFCYVKVGSLVLVLVGYYFVAVCDAGLV